MSFRVERLASSTAIELLQNEWNGLAGSHPFLSWEWLGSWWNHYGLGHELYVLAVWDENRNLVGLTPWYMTRRGPGGRKIEFLGSGKVCTDHLSLLALPEARAEVVTAVADFLIAAGQPDRGPESADAWDHLELVGVDAHDVSIRELAMQLQHGGLRVELTASVPCYFLPLPSTWDEYCKRRSKTGRRKARRSIERILSGEFTVHQVESQAELVYVWPKFVDLHQRRRQSLGEKGCFDFPPFGDFLFEASRRLLAMNKLRILVIEKDGHPVDIEYLLDDGEVLYFYQSGLDPDFIHEEPGNVTLAFCIFETIHQGYRGFDMMRGDEAYKARWRAEPVETVEVRAVAQRPAAQLRHQLSTAAGVMKSWVKGGLEMTGWH